MRKYIDIINLMEALAVQQDGYVIEYINNSSEEIQRFAVRQNGYAIRYINNPSEEVKKLASQR